MIGLRSVIKNSKTTVNVVRSYSTNNSTLLNISRLVDGYRNHGHLAANIDPLARMERVRSELLNLDRYNLNKDLEIPSVKEIIKLDVDTIDEVVQFLEKAYCDDVTAQFSHIESVEEKEWLYEKFESIQNETISNESKVEILKNLIKSEVFDHFMQKKFPTFKRYGLEGNESMMVSCDAIFKESAKSQLKNVVIGMPHRGRLNLLVQMCKYPAKDFFWKVKGNSEFDENTIGLGDVTSHIAVSSDLEFNNGEKVHVSLIHNPSHLEAVDPVAAGKTRAKQFYEASNGGSESLCLMLHGDAAVAGQGVVTETLQLSQLPGFTIGGCIHVVVNNQIGFTTIPSNGRTNRYSSDIGKYIGAPIIIVNSQSPEQVEKVSRLAVEYRQRFKKDIVIDLIGWRKFGHNEVDEPAFTQPTMYDNIRRRQSIPQRYATKIISEGIYSEAELASFTQAEKDALEAQFQLAQPENFKYSPMDHLQGKWSGLIQSKTIQNDAKLDTGYNVKELEQIAQDSVKVPADFSVHQRLNRSFGNARLDKLKSNLADWATAESMAVGSLMKQGYNVRISGQDVGRGTFSQRHFNLHDQATDRVYQPLNNMGASGKLEVVNSNLSEFAVLCYEYGYSLESPKTLPIWEAQFGDFVNTAQVAVDQFISGSEAKWLRQSSIVLLLPHGYDGAGPEHSSCRIERFLQLSDTEAVNVRDEELVNKETNFYFINPSTPANYFHALRRQMIRNYRKPLIVAGPKVLLRHPACFSPIEDMAPGTHFETVLSDPDTVSNPSAIKRVIFCSGKIFYDLQEERKAKNIQDVAIVRLEQIAPFPYERVQEEINRYSNATKFAWVQEEQQNSGAWSFVEPRFKQRFDQTSNIKYIGRPPLAAPATGISTIHKKETAKLLVDAFSF
ncbi:oxoglutarate dehydrogenase [Dictyostelium purpureum]|uniref:Oxoglutarate dehydrogenase n=1 Tax=Dictyostelium purpureum TaxID=5786 RepID=F0ZHK9_DICPU|nr:oxoglutarate dehydrogenase [Dictyostelium purpureum]EGC36599.1 oxoglutarate dehydrogenase [Dictyostelium purpureum]|eukprot:XP_003286903.1 oxoglutarate dehydrogenase [Dictyostelium purpureum]